MYAIVKTGGKQYRVEQGSSLVVERLRADEGAKVALDPLLLVDGEKMHDSGIKVEAKVVGHERGPKLRVVKFKPKRGYKRRTGHRQELTRLEVTSIKGPAARKPRASAADKEEAAAAEKPAPRRRTTTKKETASDGS
jgi:large subunit ribosomal protein L21